MRKASTAQKVSLALKLIIESLQGKRGDKVSRIRCFAKERLMHVKACRGVMYI